MRFWRTGSPLLFRQRAKEVVDGPLTVVNALARHEAEHAAGGERHLRFGRNHIDRVRLDFQSARDLADFHLSRPGQCRIGVSAAVV
jgi:hypothetical protein